MDPKNLPNPWDPQIEPLKTCRRFLSIGTAVQAGRIQLEYKFENSKKREEHIRNRGGICWNSGTFSACQHKVDFPASGLLLLFAGVHRGKFFSRRFWYKKRRILMRFWDFGIPFWLNLKTHIGNLYWMLNCSWEGFDWIFEILLLFTGWFVWELPIPVLSLSFPSLHPNCELFLIYLEGKEGPISEVPIFPLCQIVCILYSKMSAVSGVISRQVLPACGSLCFFCPALRARSRQPVKRYKKLIADIFPRNQVRFALVFYLDGLLLAFDSLLVS